MIEIEVIFMDGVFKPVQAVSLKEGTKAMVVIRDKTLLETLRKHRTAVDADVMTEFLAERR